MNMEKELEEYIDILLNKPEGEIGRRYLFERKIKKSTAIEWKMGYCPVGYNPSVYSEEKYNFWKKLWGRVVFPIYDQNGTLVSISGRKVVDVPEREKNPKYDHYPFSARKILFGLYQNKKNIFDEEKVIITEGQLDVITAWQNGVKIVTSSFGAHCSDEHLILLNRYTDNIIVIYDNDDAGNKGIEKTRQISRNLKLKVKFKNPFPVGVDMDSWLQTHSKDELYNILSYDKMSYLTNKLNKISKKITL